MIPFMTIYDNSCSKKVIMGYVKYNIENYEAYHIIDGCLGPPAGLLHRLSHLS